MWSKADELLEQSERKARLEKQQQERKEFFGSLQLDVSSTRAIVRHVSHLLKVLDRSIHEKEVEIKDVGRFYILPYSGHVMVYDYCFPDSNVFISYPDYSKSEVKWISTVGFITLEEDDVRNVIASLKVYIQNSKLPLDKAYTYRFEGGYVWVHNNGPLGDLLAKISLRTGKVE